MTLPQPRKYTFWGTGFFGPHEFMSRPGHPERPPGRVGVRGSLKKPRIKNMTALAVGGGSPYSRTGVSSAIPCSSGPWALDLETLNSRQRLGQTLNTLRFRVRLSEYYNFGRIEPGRHGCFLGLENGHLRPQIIIFSAARPL